VGSVTIMEPFQSARDADAQLSLQIPGKREQKQSALCKSVSVAGESLIDELCAGASTSDAQVRCRELKD
jgi:hypothetical protein